MPASAKNNALFIFSFGFFGFAKNAVFAPHLIRVE